MINQDNFPALLLALNFEQQGTRYQKSFANTDALLAVDMAKKELIYPESHGLTINERQTCNFSSNENFVVFECVHRLLEKGYKPEHIELEPKWKVGHGASGGRADILIKDNAGKALLIIECKTPGREFDKAWRETLQTGGQLFSYAQQISESQFLCLYASDFDNHTSRYQSYIIAHRDNEKYLADNSSLLGFITATKVEERFAIWRDTYKLDYTTKGIFEDNIQPYHIGKDKYALTDLQTLSASDQQKKYHEFATILRQHNVSGRENAFDKLVNLFLCKLVDEIENPNDLKFYWKGVAYDTHFEQLDRLQQLYQAGMGKFLNEPITYIKQDDVFNAMRFIRQNPDATQRAVWQLFIQQKFFTNNDFSFIDVHNEKLFYQNAEVLLKILQMWQDIRLTGNNDHNQFLGDMFEGFLDQGIKQSEGQFFTPMPICRFILMSLPLESLINRNGSAPKAIDYACGAGHFLNELALQIKPLVAVLPDADLNAYHKAIYGIEKEYRLSKIAKVSAFMYGQQYINICYGDALINQHAAFSGIVDNSFDLLVANPPYSVRGFLETLPEAERNAYALTDTIDKLDSNNSIEAFFIERAKQLLKAEGVAAIILPSSILSNGGTTYVKTREILLQYFDVIAIAEFGSGTFGKTGTNTVTVFLRRKQTVPDTAEHYCERVAEWFNSDQNQGIYQDAHLYHRYAQHIGIHKDDYRSVFTGVFSAELLKHETFSEYRKAFDSSTEIVNLKKQKAFSNKPATEQQAELNKRFTTFVQAIEQDKLYHFVLADTQPNKVLVIKSPSDNKLQKAFLGYEWSAAKGSEGIKLSTDTQGKHVTPLYHPDNRNHPDKLNSCIAGVFNGTLSAVPEGLADYASLVRLVDMLDFSRVGFDKQIALTTKKGVDIQCNWDLVKFGDITELRRGPFGGALKKEIFVKSGYKVYEQQHAIKDNFFIGEYYITEQKYIEMKAFELLPNDLIMSCSGTIGKIAIFPKNAQKGIINQALLRIRPVDKFVTSKFLKLILEHFNDIFYENSHGTGLKNVASIEIIKSIKIPLPPLEIQQQIVTECEAVDKVVTAAQAEIEATKHGIEEKVDAMFISGHKLKKLADTDIAVINPSKTEIRQVDDDTVVSFVEMASVSETGVIAKSIDKPLKDLRKGSYTYFAENDIIIAKITPCMENGKCALANGLSNGLGMGSSEFHVIRANKINILPEYLFALLNRQVVRTEAEKVMTGASGHRRVPASFYESYLIPVPPLADQQRLVADIQKLEHTIATAQTVINQAAAKKQAVMQKYL